MIKGMSVGIKNAEWSITPVKDYKKSTRSEDGLQRTLPSVDIMRQQREKFMHSNFNNADLKRAIGRTFDLG